MASERQDKPTIDDGPLGRVIGVRTRSTAVGYAGGMDHDNQGRPQPSSSQTVVEFVFTIRVRLS